MTLDEARAALETLGPLAPRAHGELALDLASGLGFSVGFGAAGPTCDRVNAIEVWRPLEGDVVRYLDVDVFALPALEVVARLRRHIDLLKNDDDGFTSPELCLSLWRPFAADDDPDETQGYFFQSVLVARPGYYDTPAEAAARQAAGGRSGF
ncbi:hypothetical protein ACPESR_04440 [Nocardia testacea]|uniref:hypothetical protein n=1 Tax=Nocardia testacea TaxID=248551 RepID=UPI003C2CC333